MWVPSGTAIGGKRMPAISLPSASTAHTRAPYTLSMRAGGSTQSTGGTILLALGARSKARHRRHPDILGGDGGAIGDPLGPGSAGGVDAIPDPLFKR